MKPGVGSLIGVGFTCGNRYQMRNIILASSSPRRKQLLKQLGLSFTVDASSIPEHFNPRLGPRKQAEVLSQEKAKTVADRQKDALIIASDTVVALGTELIAKPEDIAGARRMLKKLSGKTHEVFTGVTIIDTKTGKMLTQSDETKVTFKHITRDELRLYPEKEHVLDKAGGYAAQGLGGFLFIERIEGDFYNVVGLPMFLLVQMLKKFNVDVLTQA